MQSFQIYKNLAWLNDLPRDEAEAVFADCCGSSAWACGMALERPFPMLEDLYEAARRVWYSLTPADRLDAYSQNVKFVSPKPAYLLQMRTFTGPVNTQPDTTDKDIELSFAEAKRLYEDKFGFIFVLCVKEMAPADALAMCRARIGNSVVTEMRIAAAEQLKIIEINLDKLLEQCAP